MRSVLKFLASVRLAIILLILITAASILGTLIPQGLPREAYAARYGALAGAVMGLGLTGLYHSVWYIALLFILALNTIVCTLTRLPAKWRRAFRAPIETDAASIQAHRVKGRLAKSAPPAALSPGVAAALKRLRYRVRTAGTEGRIHLVGAKHRLGHFGADTVHLGLLVILAGGIVSGLWSVRNEIALREGETVAVPRAGFDIRLDKFETEYYPQGMVKAWKSTVTVVAAGRPARAATIEVNRPLSHGGFSFYQTSYGWDWDAAEVEVEATKKSDPTFAKTIRARLGERVPVDDKDVTEVAVSRFVPDLVIGEGNTIQTRSLQPNNPAALVEGWKGSEKVFSGWIFANYPEFDRMHSGKETDLSFVLKTYRAPQVSVLEAARDPGVGLIWAGCILVCAGLFLAFYWPPREIRVLVEAGRGKTELIAGGTAHKDRESFQAEFESLIESLRRP